MLNGSLSSFTAASAKCADADGFRRHYCTQEEELQVRLFQDIEYQGYYRLRLFPTMRNPALPPSVRTIVSRLHYMSTNTHARISLCVGHAGQENLPSAAKIASESQDGNEAKLALSIVSTQAISIDV